MKLNKRWMMLLCAILTLAMVSGCTVNKVEIEEGSETKVEVPAYNYSIYDVEYEITYEEAPQRAVTLSQFMTEMLLALGLEDRMVGTAYMDNEIYPDFKEAYESIPVLSDKYPSKEALFDVSPDFVSGWTSAFNEKSVASVDEYLAIGAKPFLAESITGDGSLETVFTDFIRLGKIFRVEDRAETLVADMKADVAEIEDKLKGISDEEKVRVLAYDSGTDEPFVVAGGGVSGDLIRLAKGQNIFNEIKKGYATVSWEEIIDRNPQVIIVVDYGDTDYDSKIKLLKENPALSDVEAIKNNRFVRIGLADLSPGVRNIGALRILAKGMYPDKF